MSSINNTFLPFRDRHAIEDRFKRNGTLSAKKLRQYIPVMFVNNLSVLLLVAVDEMVVGNLMSDNALAAVNIFFPATLLIGVLPLLIGSGSAISISSAVGESDFDKLRRVKSAIIRLTIIFAIVLTVIQIPLIAGIISSYNLDEHVTHLTWQYALGIMIATPFGLCSTVGTYQLQATGNMHWLMKLSIIEGLTNLALDLLFVGPCQMGVLGASLGTACANIIRCTLTIIILSKYSDVYKTGGVKPDLKTCKSILSCGFPDSLSMFMMAMENILLMKIVLVVFNEKGAVIMGVCLLCSNIVFVATRGIKGAVLPLLGILIGAHDWDGLRIVFRQCLRLVILITGAMSLFIIIFPSAFYALLGVDNIPDNGELCLRLYALSLPLASCNSLLWQYLINRRDLKYTNILTIIENITLPLMAFILNLFFPPYIVWLTFSLNEICFLIANFIRYSKWIKKDKKEMDQLIGVLSLSVSPEDAVEASSKIETYAKEKHISSRMAYRVSLCVEEMIAYAVAANKNKKIKISTTIRFLHDKIVLTFLDDGKCIALNEDRANQKIMINNYEVVKCIASDMSYQYVLNMNYTVITINDVPPRRDKKKHDS